MKSCTCDRKQRHHELMDSFNTHLLDQKQMSDVSSLFKALSDQTRIRILFALKQQELCVCDIAYTLEMTQSAISHQLKLLRDHDLVRTRRDGKSIFYRLADEHIHLIFNQAFDHVRED
jgi:ArsR family transcriptional regulator, lead/cadmium/zinc/bismuth-responsive transcriptional repressor